jgi:plasmid stabilization system protein ParE
MIRTQIHLDQELVDLVDREAARSGASRAEVIRRALRDRFAQSADEPYAVRLDRALEASFGAWKDRKFESGEEYIRALRAGDWDVIDG